MCTIQLFPLPLVDESLGVQGHVMYDLPCLTRRDDATTMQSGEQSHVLWVHEDSTDRDQQTLLRIRGLSDVDHPLSVRA